MTLQSKTFLRPNDKTHFNDDVTTSLLAQGVLNWGARNPCKGDAKDFIKCFAFTRIYEKIVLRRQKISCQMFLHCNHIAYANILSQWEFMSCGYNLRIMSQK